MREIPRGMLPRVLGCWGSFARAFLPGRLVFVQLVVQLSGLFERVQAEGAAGVGLLVGVPLHLIDRFSADALEHFPGASREEAPPSEPD